ncbi:hypothetical protein [Pontibacter pudoricolor]|uniref:hypothetical protein n=1 Tax=Pontibacter pudoricolor TaxID=2694930 RepID=UPI001391C3FB|nr:hypothetical protein [Pontibacter pudoricolor]
MKLLMIFAAVVLCFPLYSFPNQVKNGKDSFYIIFGSGFRHDTVSVAVNGIPIVDKAILLSDTISDISRDASIHSKEGKIVHLDKDLKEVKSIPFPHKRRLEIIITINGKPYHLLADLKRGRYITISKHWYYHNIYLNQYKKPITLE